MKYSIFYFITTKIVNMSNFVTSHNPFTSGVRPKQFLSARVKMLKREQMLKVIKKKKVA